MTYLCEGTKQLSTQSVLHTLLAPLPLTSLSSFLQLHTNRSNAISST